MRVALVAEGPDDARVVRALVDRLVAETAGPVPLTWTGYTPGTDFTRWTELARHQLPRRLSNRKTDFSGGLPASADALAARKALLLFDALDSSRRPSVVLLQRDDDRDQTHRRDDLANARDSGPWAFPVVVGVASPMIEAWVLAGFVPDDREEAAHADVCRLLGFDPCRHAHRLSPHHDDHARRPKAVRERLTANDPPRELSCLSEPWPLLEANGRDSGLATFAAEVRRFVLPAFGSPPG